MGGVTMNENIDLTKILEGCPKGTKFYSSIWGTVTFAGIDDVMNYPIRIKSYNKTNGEGLTQGVTKDGRYYRPFDGECILFPSKDQRDWAKFERFWDKPNEEKFNTNIDLIKILEGCPKGTKFYSIIHGEITFRSIQYTTDYPIRFDSDITGGSVPLTREGKAIRNAGECIVFPSKDQRDWSKFEKFWDKPSDKILAGDYPKTYEECISKLRINRNCKVEGYKCDLLTAFQKLLICRNAYWKIAGEEMGLGKPWKPDWSNKNELKYCIENSYDKGIHYDVLVHTQKTLAFPTYEMRDAFYDNFKELIKQCKELL